MPRSMQILRVTEHITVRRRGIKYHHDRFTEENNWVDMPLNADHEYSYLNTLWDPRFF